MLINKFSFPMYDATDGGSGGGSDNLSINDIIDDLGTDDVVTEPEVIEGEDLLKEPKEKKEKEPKEKEEDLELEEEPEVEIDETDVSDVPRKEILKKYPELFKEFPQLEKAYYREKKYAELLPTIEDAREAVAKSENYDKLETSVMNGDLNVIMDSVKTADPRAFNKMVDNYLPILSKVDQNAYFHVIGGVLKNTIVAMVQEADNLKNEDLKAAAVILNQFITGKSEFVAHKPFGPGKPDEGTEKLNNERSQFVQEKFESALEDLKTKADNTIQSTISNHIDPRGVMTDYVKRTAIKDALQDVELAISEDTRFKSVLNKLWEKSFANNFSKQTTDDIRKAYLNKAKTLLPQIIQKRRNEALKGLGKRVSGEREEPTKKGPVSIGRSASANNSSKGTAVPKGMKTLDFLNSE